MSINEPAMAMVETVEVRDGSASGAVSHIDWGAVIGGAIFAAAISFVLLTFGSAIGLSVASPYHGTGVSLVGFAIGAALWFLWVEVSSFMAGGYLAGRMRRRAFDATPHESDVRDGTHGLLVWALGTLLGAFLAIGGISGVASSVTSVAATASGNAESPAMQILASRLFRSDNAPAQPISAQTKADAAMLIADSVSNRQMNEDDRTYLSKEIARDTGITPEQAQQRVDAAIADAKAAADKARKTGLILGFLTAATLLVSAAGAFYAAGLGGTHRDEGTEFLEWFPRR
ncbi:MAG: hypothetical protein ACTHLP_19185 [Rhizobiaceae bacterium]|jgi:hypothetical protein